MSLATIRKAHHVPADKGRRVGYLGRLGTIVGAAGGKVKVRWDGAKEPELHAARDLSYFSRPGEDAPKLRADGKPLDWPFPERRVWEWQAKHPSSPPVGER